MENRESNDVFKVLAWSLKPLIKAGGLVRGIHERMIVGFVLNVVC